MDRFWIDKKLTDVAICQKSSANKFRQQLLHVG